MHGLKNKYLFYSKFLFAFFILFTTGSSYGQVNGCNDPMANNYNPLATVNDGSCTYNSTNYTPKIKVDPLNSILIESSGLQMAENYLWSFNDGGGAAAIYRIDTLTNTILQTVNLSGAVNVDWEDIAYDGTYFYLGDFGNNANGARTDLKIYKFPISEIPGHVSNPDVIISAAQIEIINFIYSDQAQPTIPSTGNNTKYDCEAMIVDEGKIHLFTKNWIDNTSTHYVINTILPGNYIAAPLETLITNYLVTGADKAIGQDVVALLGYQYSGTGNHFMQLLSGYSDGYYFNGNKRKINLPDATIMGQAEGITFRNRTYGYLSNEKFVRPIGIFTINVNQKLRSFDVSNFVSGNSKTYRFTGDGNWNEASNWSNNIIPPPTLSFENEIIIDPPPGKKGVLNIPYSLSPNAKLTVITGKDFLIQGNLIVL